MIEKKLKFENVDTIILLVKTMRSSKRHPIEVLSSNPFSIRFRVERLRAHQVRVPIVMLGVNATHPSSN